MPIIIANWKMNFLIDEAFQFCQKLSDDARYTSSTLKVARKTSGSPAQPILIGEHKRIPKFDVANLEVQEVYSDYIICPPTPYLALLAKNFPKINFGAQNVSSCNKFGAHTGEFSAEMLFSSGANYSIVGHSERRIEFSENDELIRAKSENCLSSNITPIICIGESLSTRQEKKHFEFLKHQILASIPKTEKQIIIAYEPIWSINTGIIPAKDELEESIKLIRSFLKELLVAKNILLVYGGSVTQDNINQILSVDNIDGALVGGASLQYENFINILRMANGEK
jgi:triosephosphate isomerase